jgi:hypothetical protein
MPVLPAQVLMALLH